MTTDRPGAADDKYSHVQLSPTAIASRFAESTLERSALSAPSGMHGPPSSAITAINPMAGETSRQYRLKPWT
ncbi:MAG: hypothetical protein FWD12_05950, partial [Alphaproteobacteria bacterium]|nr:hypothetical protein [Alphaproteobacteria bacterium]